MKFAVKIGLLILGSCASFQVTWAQSYTFTAINGIGKPNEINNAGQIVGSSVGGQQTRGFLYTNGVITNITAPNSINTFAYGINNNGQIVGAANGLQGGGTYGFLYVNGTFTTLSVPGSTSTVARGINDNGQIVGSTVDSLGHQTGFLYSAGTSACRLRWPLCPTDS